MEPDKFEQHIKNKLNSREIAPSNVAWEKISVGLDSKEYKGKPGYFWWSIAASVLVLVGISLTYFNTDIEENIENIKVVNTQIDAEVEKVVIKQVYEELPKVANAIVLEDSQKKEDILVSSSALKSTIELEDTGAVNNNVLVLHSNKDEFLDTVKATIVPEGILNRKIAEVIAQVDALALSNVVTDAELDSLLLKAQKDILKENLFSLENTVNPMALLTEVEDELDQSFRDQIFESLKTRFLKVRTAVADRNK